MTDRKKHARIYPLTADRNLVAEYLCRHRVTTVHDIGDTDIMTVFALGEIFVKGTPSCVIVTKPHYARRVVRHLESKGLKTHTVIRQM